jgi:hypothetical protein
MVGDLVADCDCVTGGLANGKKESEAVVDNDCEAIGVTVVQGVSETVGEVVGDGCCDLVAKGVNEGDDEEVLESEGDTETIGDSKAVV